MASDPPAEMPCDAPSDAPSASFFAAESEAIGKCSEEGWAVALATVTSGQIVRPDLSGNLLTCKAFLDLQGPGVDIGEAKKAYLQYKQDYELRFAEVFYMDHKTEPWFLERFDPVLAQEAIPGRLLVAQLRHKQFISDFQEKAFAGILLRDAAEAIVGPPMFAFDPNRLTLFLGLVPVSVWRREVLTAVQATPGFVSLSISEPIASQGFSRFAWARFDTESHCEEACRLLTNVQVTNSFAITPAPSQRANRKPLKTQPPQSLPGLLADWKQVTALIVHLDQQFKVTENQLLVSEERFAGMEEAGKEEQLDLQLLYLRRVYGVCYYCGDFFEDERELAAKCGPMHLRSRVCGTQESPGSVSESKFSELQKKCSLIPYDQAKDDKLQSSIGSLISSLTIKESASNVRCGNCKKLFFDANYLRKHILAKHDELLAAVRETHYEKLRFERFLQDCCKFVFLNSMGDNARSPVKRMREEPYQDLDDPKRERTRRIVDYSDI